MTGGEDVEDGGFDGSGFGFKASGVAEEEGCGEEREDRLGGVIADGQLRAVGLVVVANDHVSSSSMSAYRRRHDPWWQGAPTLSWLGLKGSPRDGSRSPRPTARRCRAC